MQLLLMKQEIIMPFNSDKFNQAWSIWKQYKKEQFKFNYKGTISEQAALKSLSEDSGHDEEIAIRMINMAMANGWRGIFPIKTVLKKELTLQQKILQGL